MVNRIIVGFTTGFRNNRAEVNQWGIIGTTTDFDNGDNLDSLFEKLDNFKEPQIVFIHKGSNFGFEFLKHWLGENRDYSTKKFLKPGEAKILAKDSSMTYGIEYKNKFGKVIHFRDLHLFISRESIKERETNTKEEKIEYLKEKLTYERKYLEAFDSQNNLKVYNYTATSVAWKEFKDSIDNFDDLYKDKITLDEWKYLDVFRYGAFNLLNYKHEGKLLRNIKSFDVNGMYSYVMRNKPMPYGKPIYGCDLYDCEHELNLIKVKIFGKIKDNNIPFIPNKTLFRMSSGSLEYPTEFRGEILSMTQSMFVFMSEYYDIEDYEIIEKVCFNHTMGIGHKFIDKYVKVKQEAEMDSPERQDAKDKLNHSYGRTGMSPIKEEWYMKKILPGDKVKKADIIYGNYYMSHKTVEDEEGINYIPLSIFILDWGRQMIIKVAQKIGIDRFVYVDTDGIKIRDWEDYLVEWLGIDVDSKRLGAFKDEGLWKYGIFFGRKMYSLTNAPLDTKYEVNKNDEMFKFIGAGLSSVETFNGLSMDDLVSKGFQGVAKQKMRVEGGVILTKREKNLIKVKNILDSVEK